MTFDLQRILRKNWFHKRVWRDVGTTRHLYLDNDEIKLLRIYQTIDALICLKFFSQYFLPYKSWKWWKLWINNETYLDGFGNFKHQERPMDLLTDDAHKIWIDPVPWFKVKKKRSGNTVVKYNTGVYEKQSIKDEKARLDWSFVMAHGWTKAKSCFYCQKPLTRSQKTRDHVIPRSRTGGFKHNIVASCRSCNGKKGNRAPSEWRELIRYDALNRDLSENTKAYYGAVLVTLNKLILE